MLSDRFFLACTNDVLVLKSIESVSFAIQILFNKFCLIGIGIKTLISPQLC